VVDPSHWWVIGVMPGQFLAGYCTNLFDEINPGKGVGF
jgi:hypothetical protein